MIVAFGVGMAMGVAAYLMIDRVVLARRSKYYSPAIGRAALVAAYSLMSTGLTFGIVRWFVLPPPI